MEKITNLEYKKEDDESTRQEKNRILVGREVFVCFSYGMNELLKKELVSFEDIENQTETDEELLKNYMGDDLKTDEEKDEYINHARDNGEADKEIYEYWIVSEWLYNKLKEINEPVLEWADLYIWGRTCTGQSICLDSTMDEIRKLLN